MQGLYAFKLCFYHLYIKRAICQWICYTNPAGPGEAGDRRLLLNNYSCHSIRCIAIRPVLGFLCFFGLKPYRVYARLVYTPIKFNSYNFTTLTVQTDHPYWTFGKSNSKFRLAFDPRIVISDPDLFAQVGLNRSPKPVEIDFFLSSNLHQNWIYLKSKDCVLFGQKLQKNKNIKNIIQRESLFKRMKSWSGYYSPFKNRQTLES